MQRMYKTTTPDTFRFKAGDVRVAAAFDGVVMQDKHDGNVLFLTLNAAQRLAYELLQWSAEQERLHNAEQAPVVTARIEAARGS